MEKEKNEAIESAVKEQSKLMRKQIQEEFNRRLALEINSKEAEFEKKKADLPLEIQRKAKKLFE